jgi:predicted DCC family thiol-disulfide oxidoreductase YuxK
LLQNAHGASSFGEVHYGKRHCSELGFLDINSDTEARQGAQAAAGNLNREMVELFIDGDCRLCMRSVGFLRRFDDSGAILVHNAADPSVHEELRRRSGKDPDVNRAMWALSSERLYEGYDAFRIAFLDIPKLRLVGRLMNLAPVRYAGRFVYRAVADNRKSLGCSAQCSLP